MYIYIRECRVSGGVHHEIQATAKMVLQRTEYLALAWKWWKGSCQRCTKPILLIETSLKCSFVVIRLPFAVRWNGETRLIPFTNVDQQKPLKQRFERARLLFLCGFLLLFALRFLLLLLFLIASVWHRPPRNAQGGSKQKWRPVWFWTQHKRSLYKKVSLGVYDIMDSPHLGWCFLVPR